MRAQNWPPRFEKSFVGPNWRPFRAWTRAVDRDRGQSMIAPWFVRDWEPVGLVHSLNPLQNLRNYWISAMKSCNIINIARDWCLRYRKFLYRHASALRNCCSLFIVHCSHSRLHAMSSLQTCFYDVADIYCHVTACLGRGNKIRHAFTTVVSVICRYRRTFQVEFQFGSLRNTLVIWRAGRDILPKYVPD